MKKALVLLLLVSPSFAAVHAASHIVKFTAKTASYPVRHPKKTVHGVSKVFTGAAKTAI